jgi:hypothetical protein
MREFVADPSTADWMLALIPVTLLASILTGMISSLSMTMAVGAGSVPASGMVGYAMFCTPLEN